MHRMQWCLPHVLQHGHAGPALEGSRELIEPPHLASGEAAGTGGDQVFCLIERDLSGEVLRELAHADGFHDGRVYLLFAPDHVPEAFGLAEALVGDPFGPLGDRRVENGPSGTEV